MTRFNTTRWSLIADAAGSAANVRPALEALCRDYLPPVLAYIRQHGFNEPDAEDIAQDFFAGLIERNWHAAASQERGRFRALILTALRHFLLDAQTSRRAQKRGGGTPHIAFDDDIAPEAEDSPERSFTQAWIGVVIDRARVRLRDDFDRTGRSDHFRSFWNCIDGHADSAEITELAAALGLRRNTVAVQLHRMRARFRQLIREELLATMSCDEDLAREIEELRDALGIDLSASAKSP